MQKKGVAACLKHFAANSQERDRCDESSEIDERTLRKIYLKAFEIAVKKSNPASVMCAYNKINSIWCSENKMLLTEILRDEWNYDGFVVSDWGAGGAIADVLSGKVNPSGKLPETFPTAQRRDIDYPGDGLKVEYREKLNVGYRYYASIQTKSGIRSDTVCHTRNLSTKTAKLFWIMTPSKSVSI